MNEGRKTRRYGGGPGEKKNKEKAKLDREWQKISAVSSAIHTCTCTLFCHKTKLHAGELSCTLIFFLLHIQILDKRQGGSGGGSSAAKKQKMNN